jgi:AcrR family transcriptional regulator
LSREDVAGRQRTRILDAFAEVLAERRGYVNTPVAAIIERAGVSRETFYEQFDSKQDCFIAALERAVQDLGGLLTGLLAKPGTPLERFDRMLRGYLDALATRPDAAWLFLVETYAAGVEAMQRRLELQAEFVDGLLTIFDRRSARDRAACEALVGATVALVTARFVAGDVAGVHAVRRPLVDLASAWLSAR